MAEKIFYQDDTRILRYQVMDGVSEAPPLSATFMYVNDESGAMLIEETAAGVDPDDAIITYTLTPANGGTSTPGFYRAVFTVTFTDGEIATLVVHVQIKERIGKEEPPE